VHPQLSGAAGAAHDMKGNASMMGLRGTIAACVTTIIAAGMAAVAGCSSSSSSAGPTSDAGVRDATSARDVVASPSSDGGDAGGASYALNWSVALSATAGIGAADAMAGGAPDGGFEGVAGVKVCVDGHSEIPCVMSAADGTFTLAGLPGGANLLITLAKDGYLSVLKPIQMGRMDEQNGFPIFMTMLSDGLPDAGFVIDQVNKGLANVFLLSTAPPPDAGPDSGLMFSIPPGGTLSISPASGNGPEYVDNSNQIDTTATSLVGISAMFYNLDPGNYTVTGNAPNFDCEPINFPFSADGYPTGTSHQVGFPVKAGYVDLVGLLCSPSSQIVSIDGG
jgi:hypothetical protein